MRTLITRGVLLFITAAATAFVAAFPEHVAQAKFIQRSASACFVGDHSDTYSANSGVVTNFASDSMQLYCPFPARDGFRHDGVTFLSVDVRDTHATASTIATACITDYNGTSHFCGSSDSSTGGHESLFPALTYWSSTYYADYPYVLLNMTGYGQSMHGFYASGP